MPTSQKKGSSAKKKTTAKNSTAKRTAQKTSKAAKNAAASNRKQVGAIVLFAIALFLLFVTLIPGTGAIWLGLQNVVFGLFGVMAYVIPFLLMAVAVLISLDRDTDRITAKVVGVCVLILFICSAVYVFGTGGTPSSVADELVGAFRSGKSSPYGGFFGALLGAPLYLMFGKVPAAATLILLAIVTLMLMTGTTLGRVVRGVYEPAKSAKESTSARIEEQKAVREERRAQREEEREQQQANRQSFNPDVDLGPSPKRRRRNAAKTEEPETPAEDAVTFRKGRGRKTETPAAEPVTAKETAAAAATIAADGTVLGDNLDAIVKKASASQKQQRPKSAPIDDTPFDTEAARETVKEMEKASSASPKKTKYKLPPLDCLNPPKVSFGGNSEEELRENAQKLIDVLKSFGVTTTLVDIARGPSVTRYELAPAAGVKMSRITNLADDIALNLAASGVRIAPIPGKTAVGIEVPNRARDTVTLREILESATYKKGAQKSRLSVALGKDISGNVCIMDIAKMPHLLIAGTTGSGKSVCVNAMVLSILYNATPDEVKLVMIDPKKVEFIGYNGIPHLLIPVVTEPAKAAGALQWAVREMNNRYQAFAENGVRDIKGYNELAATQEELEPFPQICIFIDELADLMMATPKEVEDSICRLAQMARAAGMHLVIATQRPSVDVITGLIKANIPSRLSLSVSSAVDSRTILDMAGAEKLLGNGDMLFNPVGVAKPTRIQGCFSTEAEVERVVDFIKAQETSDYDEEVLKDIEQAAAAAENANKKGGGVDAPSGGNGGDDLYNDAVKVVVEAGQASTSMLQRKLGVGYARAGRLIDELEEHGIIGEYQGSKPRAVLITKQQYLEMNAMSGDNDAGENAAIELGLDE